MPEKYEALRAALAAQPTPGPWQWLGAPGGWDAVGEPGGQPICELRLNNPANAEYIGAANPESIGALLAERDALHEALRRTAGAREIEHDGTTLLLHFDSAEAARAAYSAAGGMHSVAGTSTDDGLCLRHYPAGPVPIGAIHNGRTYADRLESTGLECEAGRLSMCSDWAELRRCFEALADWACTIQPQLSGNAGTLSDRAAFEAWASGFMGWDITPNNQCGYRDKLVTAAWFGWGGRERSELAAQPAGLAQHDMQKAVEAFQIADDAYGKQMADAGHLFDPALGVESGLLAALPFLLGEPAEKAQPAGMGALRALLAAGNRLDAESEECEGPDGAAVMIGLDYWNEFSDALDHATLALSPAPDAAVNDSSTTAHPAEGAPAIGSDLLDAERYRLLRRGQKWSVIDGAGDMLRADDLDAAIDAARQGQGDSNG